MSDAQPSSIERGEIAGWPPEGWSSVVIATGPLTSDALAQGLRDRGHRHASTVADAGALAATIADAIRTETLGAGDMIICLGAGDITKMAAGLASAVEAV